MIRALLAVLACYVFCGCKSTCPYCGKESYLENRSLPVHRSSRAFTYRSCEECKDKMCRRCHSFSREGTYDSYCQSCRKCWLCGKANCTIERMGGKWVCDSHYCSIHNHGFEEVWTGEKSEPHCPRCYHEQQEQEKKLAKEQRQKKEEQKRLEYEKAMSEAAEQKRKMDAVKIESILGVHFGDKYRWIRDKPISTQDGGGKVTISFEKPFRCFMTAEIFATPMERAYMLLARREFDVVSRSNLEREQMAIVEMLEKKFGMVFPRKSNDIIIFENDNVKVEVGIFTFNDKDGGVIAFCITNKAIRKEDNKAFLEKGFKSADKEDGADLL